MREDNAVGRVGPV